MILIGFWFGVDGKKLMFKLLVNVLSCLIVVGWYMLVEIINIFFLLCFFRSLESLFMDVVLFVFCKLVIKIIVGGWVVRFNVLLDLFIIVLSCWWMILMNFWFGVRDLEILIFIVFFLMWLMKLWMIGSVMFVFNSVMCILCRVFLMLFLVRWFLLLIFFSVLDNWLVKFLNIFFFFFKGW